MASLTSPAHLVLILLLFLQLALSTPTREPGLTGRRNLALMEEDDDPPALKPPPKKKPISQTTNQTKPIKLKKSNSTTDAGTTIKIKLPKLNKTLNAASKSTNSTKLPKPIKSNSTKTQFKSLNSTKTHFKSINSTKTQFKPINSTSKSTKKIQSLPLPINKPEQPTKPDSEKPNLSTPWMYADAADDDADFGGDLIAEFRGLPARLIPDLELLSATSKTYISRANREIAEGVKPYVGHRYASSIASFASAAFLVVPLLLLALLLRRISARISVQRFLIAIQAYLAIYFATLAVTALATGLEPLRFFYVASPASYAWTQAVQTMGYVVYLVAQLVNLVVVFSGSGEGSGDAAARALGLAQMVVGLAVGMHYYAVVFHRAVTGDPPRANWRVHGMYAACFLVICALARAERRKKAYLQDGGEDDGKKS